LNCVSILETLNYFWTLYKIRLIFYAYNLLIKIFKIVQSGNIQRRVKRLFKINRKNTERDRKVKILSIQDAKCMLTVTKGYEKVTIRDRVGSFLNFQYHFFVHHLKSIRDIFQENKA
jgi:hypothetical protein